MELAAVLAAGDALRRLNAGLAAKAGVVMGVAAVLLVAGLMGVFDQLSLAKEAANRREAFADAVSRHGFLVTLSVALALLIGVPLGIAAQRRPRWHTAIFGALDIVQTIPSIALFGLLIGPLAALSGEFPALRRIGISGIGVAPAIIALVLYSLLPMARGAFAGLASVPQSVVETARGMGMTAGQILGASRRRSRFPCCFRACASSPFRRSALRSSPRSSAPAALEASSSSASASARSISCCSARCRPSSWRSRSISSSSSCSASPEERREEVVVIELDHVVKRYGGHGAVDGMSLTIEARMLCAFVGPSGCGKSTTLRLINALIRPDEGAIRIDGQDIAAIKPETLRRGIGYVIQSIGLFPHWNVADNIATVPRLLRWPKARIEARIDELLHLLRLEPADSGQVPASAFGRPAAACRRRARARGGPQDRAHG